MRALGVGRLQEYRVGQGPESLYTIARFLGFGAYASAEEFSLLDRQTYDDAVFGLGSLGRRLVEGTVGLFALLGFIYVPLGRHTGFEHARAVLATPAAQAAVEDVTASVLSLRQRAVDLITGHVSPPAAPADEAARAKLEPPRPVPPKLK